MADEQLNLGDLGQQISETFNTSELQNLCLDLGIDYEALPVPPDAAGKQDKIRALILYCQRHGRLPDLLEALQEKRPSTHWKSFNHLTIHHPMIDSPIPSQRRRFWWIGGVVVLVVLFLGIGWLWWQPDNNGPAATAVPIQPAISQPEAKGATAVPSPVTSNPTAESQTLPGVPEPTAPPSLLSGLNISNTPGDSGNPQLLVDDANTLHFIWYDTTPQLSGAVLYRQRTIDGAWSDVTNLTENFDFVREDSLRLLLNLDDQVCAFWDTPGSSQPSGYYMRCLSGSTWWEPELVKPFGGATNHFRPAFAPDGAVHLIYMNGTNLFYDETQLSDGFQSANHPSFVIDGQGVFHAVWVRQGQPFSLEYRSSLDNGHTWSEVERLTDDQSPADFLLSLLADTQGQVHLVWFADDMAYYRRWVAEAGWESSIKILPGKIDNSCGRAMLIGEDQLHLAWQGSSGLFYLEQTETLTWSSPRLITEDLCDFDSPALAIDGVGNRHFVWNKQPDDARDFYYALLPVGE
jgi:hypothetical protein